MPGVTQLATHSGSNGGWVDLEAQVIGTTVSSYSWNTSGLGSYTAHMSATNTYQLTFQWSGEPESAANLSLSLSVTDTNSHTETFTFDYWMPAGNYYSLGSASNATWPTSLAPDQELDSAPAFASDGASVDATSGALDTIDTPAEL